MKQLLTKLSWSKVSLVLATVIIVMTRSLWMTKFGVPIWFYGLFIPAYLIFLIHFVNILLNKGRLILQPRFWKMVGFFLVANYLLTIVYRVNHVRFRWWKIITNNFFQLELLLTILPALIVVYLLFRRKKWWEKWNTHFGNFTDTCSPEFLLTLLFSLTKLAVSYWKDVYYDRMDLGDFTSYFIQVPIYSLIYMSGLYFLLKFAWKAYRDLRANRLTLRSSLLLNLLLAFLANYAFQVSMAGGGSYFRRYLFPGAMILQIFFLFCLNVIITLVINRQVLASYLILFINFGLAVANYLKFNYRSEPLVPNDFKWISDIGMILSFINLRNLIIVLIPTVLLVLSYSYSRKHFLPGKVAHKGSLRLGISVLLINFILGTGILIRNEKDHQIIPGIPILSQVHNWKNVDWKGYTFIARYRGLSYLWLEQLSKKSMVEPVGYSEDNIKAIVAKYDKLAQEINQERSHRISDQTVIYILSESFANPNRLPSVHISQNVVPKIETIMANTTSGLMKSDAYGGGTANMEFQSLSGLPFYNFTSSISSVYLDIAPSMNYFPTISDSFAADKRLAIHPYYETSYNRNSIYSQLDFAKFMTLDSKTTPIKLEEGDKLGNFASDQKTYQEIMNQLDGSGKQFISAMTMQNHTQWVMDEPANITAFGDGFTEQENSNLSAYVRLLSYTDHATQDFLDQLKQRKEKISVVFYGDHLPGLYPETAFTSDPSLQYKTDFFVWSNFETKQQHYNLINSSDLTAVLLETTESQVSPYQALLTEVLHKASVDKEADPQVSEDLKMVQYDLTTGQGYLSQHKSFFEVRKTNNTK